MHSETHSFHKSIDKKRMRKNEVKMHNVFWRSSFNHNQRKQNKSNAKPKDKMSKGYSKVPLKCNCDCFTSFHGVLSLPE